MDSKFFSTHTELNRYKIDDRFWHDKIELVRNEVIPYQYRALNDMVEGAEKSYCIENFKKAKKAAEKIKNGIDVPVYPVDRWEYRQNECDDASFHGWVFQDSDAYKWIEAVGFSLINHPDKELEEKADRLIDLICSAQLENGYLDTLFIINDTSKVFTNLKDWHELYCFGHMAEAGVSYYNATKKRKLLDTVCKFADLICNTFCEEGIKGYPGHEIAEMALVKLYDTTGNSRYLDAAKFFIDERGKKPYYFDSERGYNRNDNSEDYFYNQAHRQPRHQHEAVGHAVRGVYLYSAMADLAKKCNDTELYTACCDIWDNIVNKKMYITGGIGSTVDGEAFSFDYDLPNDLAYAETCASIGLIFFARRMLEIYPKSEYADVMERALYNTVLSGMSEDGKSFFYVNPLEVLPEASRCDARKRHIKPVRQKWFSCACCPPNLSRLISSLGEYCTSENDEAIFVHLYAGGKIKSDKADIDIESSYLDDGKVNIFVNAKKEFTLALRLPFWSDCINISEKYREKDGYAYINISKSTNISIEFEIKPRLIKCSNNVRASIGRVAVMRGPIVYCAEEIDNGADLQLLSLGTNPQLRYENGVIYAKGFREEADDKLYSKYESAKQTECEIKLIPYHMWANRGENEMSVYLRI